MRSKIFVDKRRGFCYYKRAGKNAGVAQPVEQLICNQQVGGSNPSTSSSICGGIPEWPKGTDCKSAGNAFGGSNPPSPTRKKQPSGCFFQWCLPCRANDVRFAYDAASLMMCPAGHWGKHLIIDRKAIYIISERREDTSSAAIGGDIIDFCVQIYIIQQKGERENERKQYSNFVCRDKGLINIFLWAIMLL